MPLSAPLMLYGVVSAALLYLVVPPFVVLLQTSVWVAQGVTTGRVSLENYTSIFSSADLPSVLLNSILYALESSCIGLALGVLIAWLVERSSAPFKELAYVTAFVSFAIPGIIKAIGWTLLLGPRNGLLTVILTRTLNVSGLPLNLYSLQGMAIVQGLIWVPAAFLLMTIPFRAINPYFEEAAATSGADGWRTALRVTLPLAKPAMLGVLLLTFVRGIEDFEVPAVIGMPGRVFVLATQIYLKMTTGATADYGVASAYGVVLLALVCGGIYLYTRATADASRFQTVTGKSYQPRKVELGRGRALGGLLVLMLPLTLALPVAMLLWASLQPFYSRPSRAGLSQLTANNYWTVFAGQDTQVAFYHTLFVAVVVSTAATALTAAGAWLVVRTKFRSRSFVDYAISATMAFPGLVLGVALIRTYLTVPIPIYGTLWILVVAYLTRFMASAMRYVHPGLLQIHSELEESARMSGAGYGTVFYRIAIPLMAPALAAAWVSVFLSSVRELTVAVLLVGPNSGVVSSTIYSMWNHGDLTGMSAFSVTATVVFVALAYTFRRASLGRGL
jgi:iron(III) transport system permease protein